MSQVLLKADQPRGSLPGLGTACPSYAENSSLGPYLALHFLLRVLRLILQLPMGVDIGKGLNFSFLTQLFPKK